MCIGRGGVVTAQRRRSTVAIWGRSSFRPSSARTASFCVAIATATFPESRLSYAPFFREILCARAAGGLRCVHGREAKGHDARRGVCLSEERGGMHHFRPLYDRPADFRSQIEAGRPAWQPSPPPEHSRCTRTGFPLDAKRCKWHVVGVRYAATIGTNKTWRAIWLRWLELDRGRSPGRHFGEVAARPAPQIEGAFDATRPSVRAG